MQPVARGARALRTSTQHALRLAPALSFGSSSYVAKRNFLNVIAKGFGFGAVTKPL